MGFNKRYIHKGMILDNINNISYIKNLVNADSLILDSWSKKFFDNFNFKSNYQKIRSELNEDTKLSSNLSDTKNHSNFNKLKNMSNILINLKTNPKWVDVILVQEILDVKDIDSDKRGKFDFLVQDSIERINSIYTD
jgi:hypothetical protein